MGSGQDIDRNFGIWAQSAPPGPDLPELSGRLNTDTVIIGAGYTGLSTAMHLARSDARCVLIEAREPGWGESGRNTGWLEPNWWMKDPGTIRARFGEEIGKALSREIVEGPALLERWRSDHGLMFEWDPCGLVMGTADSARAEKLAEESRDWSALGIDYPYLDDKAMSRHVPAAYFKGGLLLPTGGTLNPLAFSRELARALLELEVPVLARSPARAVEHRDGRWWVRADHGEITAKSLILATGASTQCLWPPLASAQAIWCAGVIASKPYAALDDLLPAGTAVADLDLLNVFTLRRADGNRLVTSVLSPVRSTADAGAVAAPFMRKFRRLFPDFPEPTWSHVHYGNIGLSRDMLPRLCKIGPNAWTAFGYSGTGINYALLFGGYLARLALSGEGEKPLYPIDQLANYPLRRTVAAALRYLHAPISRGIISRFGPRKKQDS